VCVCVCVCVCVIIDVDEVSLKSMCWKFLSSMWMDKNEKAYRHYLPLFCDCA